MGKNPELYMAPSNNLTVIPKSRYDGTLLRFW